MTAPVAQAYATCASITRDQARNFHYGIRLLPPAKRAAMSAVYALARRIDDIGDGDLPADEKLVRLAKVRAALSDPSRPDDSVMVAVRHAALQFPIPLDAFGELVEYLFRSQSFPHGAMLLTGAGVVPPDSFTLADGDRVRIAISGVGTLENSVRVV